MNFSIISIGNELIQGRINDTNGTYISKKIFEKGFDLEFRFQVPDREDKIIDALDYAIKKSDVIFITGGLGGTSDDITKEVVANYLNKKLILKKEILNDIKDFFKKMRKPFPDLNKKVAYVIEDAIIHKNRIGFAPCLEINQKGKKIFLLPGMREELEDFVDRLFKDFRKVDIYKRTYKLFGITECNVEERLENLFGEKIKDYVFYYPSFKGLAIKIITKQKQDFLKISRFFKKEFKEYIYSENDEEIEYVLGRMLKKSGLTISIAESCTGGLILDLITDVPGSSEYFIGGVVAYSNESKIQILNVKKDTLKKYGAVSENVAAEMAEGVRNLFKTDIGISTTGIAGPSGGSKEKPVGLVYIGISIKNRNFVKRYIFKQPRTRIKMNASCAALFNVIKELK